MYCCVLEKLKTNENVPELQGLNKHISRIIHQCINQYKNSICSVKLDL
jgi:hypothetical protein